MLRRLPIAWSTGMSGMRAVATLANLSCAALAARTRGPRRRPGAVTRASAAQALEELPRLAGGLEAHLAEGPLTSQEGLERARRPAERGLRAHDLLPGVLAVGILLGDALRRGQGVAGAPRRAHGPRVLEAGLVGDVGQEAP